MKGNSILKQCCNCNVEFKVPEWNEKRKYCSKKCSVKHCGLRNRKTLEDILLTIKNKHSEKYDYSLLDISNGTKGKVKIICPVHGVFEQALYLHLNGKGCLLCAKDYCRKTTHKYIEEAKEVHGEKYDYSLVKYETNAKKIKIICKIHGIFEQIPYQHLNLKSGCKECSKLLSSSRGEKDWLDSLNIPNDNIHRQVSLTIDNKLLVVDGLKDNVIYEYLGDYWHGNPLHFNKTDINKSVGKSYEELFNETFNRFKLLETAGYAVKYIWESQWLEKN
jgi:hypothetical protein